MPLNRDSPIILHILQNLSLIFLSALFVPLCTSIAIISCIISPFTPLTEHINKRRTWRTTSPRPSQRRTILVTGVGMSKGLFLARAFYRAGHRVIGADFEPYDVPVCGRFSVALDRFYRLSKPLGAAASGSRKYVSDLVEIAKKEKVELWVSCSGVASAVEDGEAAEAVESLTNCRAIQFGVALTTMLHEKHSFIENTRSLGLTVPDTHLVTSVADAMKFFYFTFPPEGKIPRKYILKSVGMDDTVRADMTLLPHDSSSSTHNHLRRLNPSPSRPFVLQRFIPGPEYCTHSLIIAGQVRAFVACPSSDLLMHYKALPSTSALSEAMLTYTQIYAAKMGPAMTGHFSIDFLYDQDDYWREKDLIQNIYPIECNPRAHTAVVLFANESEALADAYLSVLSDDDDDEPSPISPTTTTPTSTSPSLSFSGPSPDSSPCLSFSSTTPGGRPPSPYPFPPAIITPGSSGGPRSNSYFWIGHDIVTLLILPFWALTRRKMDLAAFVAHGMAFLEHVLFWRDGTFEVWDPWPAWWLYCVYWPAMCAVAVLGGQWWSRCNVSTGKIFRC